MTELTQEKVHLDAQFTKASLQLITFKANESRYVNLVYLGLIVFSCVVGILTSH